MCLLTACASEYIEQALLIESASEYVYIELALLIECASAYLTYRVCFSAYKSRFRHKS